ncbi:hypothetical protein GCM10022631_19070 [Deinococcus rubellus]|uniref:Uncharacterized protein n=1 Tax=Deinococcus rubellus TaxID=1889240 RepID=A0ABY5YHX4_9DEIO|nr:hypothetical protein [Deinococcus rubellus]UWX63702.1 hypothetical protein N0D28_13340 [Deinococcus rubellus]
MNAALWPYWSWVLPILGVTALYASGSGKRWGWLVGFAGQLLWIVYALLSQQYGFLLSAAAFAAIYARNYLHWRGDVPARQFRPPVNAARRPHPQNPPRTRPRAIRE